MRPNTSTALLLIMSFNLDNGAMTSGSIRAFLLSPTSAVVGPYAKPPCFSAGIPAASVRLAIAPFNPAPNATKATPATIASTGFRVVKASLIPLMATP